MKTLKLFFFLWASMLMLSTLEAADQLPALGTIAKLGSVYGVEIETVVQSPSAQETPLQIVCIFEYSEGDIYNSPPALSKELNGLVHVDQALKGLITDLRKTKQFKGELLETLLITAPENSVTPKKILLIGLGNRDNFKPEIMRLVGITGMREALRLGVKSYAHASDLKDAGIDSPTSEVAGNVIQGALEAYRTQNFLKEKQASAPLTVTKIMLLAGPAYLEDTLKGIKQVLNKIDHDIERPKEY